MKAPKAKPTTDADRAKASALIESYIAHPPAKRSEVAKHDRFDAVSIIANLDGFRAKLAKERGMTLEQWKAMEDAVQHPRDVVPIVSAEAAIARRRMSAAGVPLAFAQDVTDRLVDCQPLREVKAFLNGGDGFRVLSGGKGTRKTGSACWALGQLDRGVFVHAKDVVGLMIEKKPQWERVLSSPAVVFDDLGFEKRDGSWDTFREGFSRLVDAVYANRRRLIITCNMTATTFRESYGEREYDRLRHVGKWSTIAGESVRQYQTHFTEREPGEEG
jgi:hypothetical protein